MEDFDFIRAFVDFDRLKAEAIANIVGTVVGKLYSGMVDAGVPDDRAQSIIMETIALLPQLVASAAPKSES